MRWLRMVKAVKTGGGWGFLGVLVFTSHVKAIQCVSIKLKSMAVVGFGIDGCLVKFVWTQRQSERQEVSLSICLSAVLFIKHPTFLQCKQILSEVSSRVLSSKIGLFFLKNNCWALLHYQQGNNLKAEYMTLLKWFVCGLLLCLIPVLQPADPLEEATLSGIVFRLSSLTITKALIRLVSSSSAGSDDSLVPLFVCY